MWFARLQMKCRSPRAFFKRRGRPVASQEGPQSLVQLGQKKFTGVKFSGRLLKQVGVRCAISLKEQQNHAPKFRSSLFVYCKTGASSRRLASRDVTRRKPVSRDIYRWYATHEISCSDQEQVNRSSRKSPTTKGFAIRCDGG